MFTRVMALPCGPVAAAVVAVAMLAGAAAGQQGGKTLEQRRAEILMRQAGSHHLYVDAQSRNFAKSVAAIKKLGAGDASQKVAARAATLKWLRGDRTAVQRALGSIGKTDALTRHLEKLTELQKLARANIRVLEKGEKVKLAHEYYEQLQVTYEPLDRYYRQCFVIMQRMARRPGLLELWETVKREKEMAVREADEEKLRQRAEVVLGMSLADARAIVDAGMNYTVPEDDAFKKMMVHYLGSRQVEEYNESVMAEYFGREELANARLVNQYREWLGIWPYEWDARLAQAARRHSKSMVDRGFFSHTSPVPDNKSFGDRCRNAGYPRGSGENIAAGSSSGERTFWQWFDSPGHHKNMAGGHRALGVGRWGNHTTQVFGRGERLMPMTPEQREQVKIKGDILKPRG